MNVKIYCIEDVNGNKYIGSTCRRLKDRLWEHKSNNCSSCKLDLYNSFIYTIEECNECDRKIKEQYWIDNTRCVNINNPLKKLSIKEYNDEYYKNKKDEINYKRKQLYKNNPLKKLSIKESNNEYYLFKSKKVVNGCYDFIEMLNTY